MDELVGVAGGAMNVGANLAKDNPVSSMDAFKTGYQIARDDWRNSEQIARDAWPTASAIVDTTAQMSTPMNFLKTAKATPLAAKANTRAINNVFGGALNGIGETEGNNPYDYAKNIAINSGANFMGNRAANNAMGRGGDEFTRSVMSGTHSQAFNKVGKMVTNLAENNNPFSAQSFEEDDEWWKKTIRLIK